MLFGGHTPVTSANHELDGVHIDATWWIRLEIQLYQLKGNSVCRSDSVYTCIIAYPFICCWRTRVPR